MTAFLWGGQPFLWGNDAFQWGTDDSGGRPYPAGPQPGSNGIGLFTIGVSPVGDIPPFDFWDTIYDQYANSPTITGVIGSFAAAADQTKNFNELYDQVWNIDTAGTYGLAVWGRIVGIGNVIPYTSAPPSFGFAQASDALTFGQGTFYGGINVTTNYTLSNDAYRQLIKAKAAANISDCSIPSINNILQILFPNRGNAYVADNGDMSMTYTFAFALTAAENAVIRQSGVLPSPSGVSVSMVTSYHFQPELLGSDSSLLESSDHRTLLSSS